MSEPDPMRPLLLRFLGDADADAMEELVRRTRPRLLRAARRIGGREDAEDAVQAAYHALLRRTKQPPEAPIFPWLLVATVRIAYRRRARQRQEQAIADHLAHPHEGPSGAAARAEEAGLLRSAIARLPAKYRDVVVLHHIEELPVKETARILDVPRSTVTTRLRRARRLLRGRLSPSLAYGLLLLPWMFVDALRDLSMPALGTTMKAKTALVLTGVALGAGAAGLGIGIAWDRRAPAPRQVETGGALRAEVDRLREEVARLRDRPAREVPTPELPPATPPKAATEQHDGRRIPEKVKAAARALAVPDDALQAAWAAHLGFDGSNHMGDEALFRLLEDQGETGFRALVAILRGGVSGSWFVQLFEKSWKPHMAGMEQLLIEIVEADGIHAWSKWSALSALGVTDTPRARDYLVQRIDTETQGGLFMCAARSLGRLKEPRALGTLARQVRNKDWNDKLRGPALYAITQIAGDGAADLLVDYLREPHSDMLETALLYLARIDAAAARREAEALLDGPRRDGFGHAELAALRRYAGRRKR